MIDPADQRASDEAIKRNTNLTPTEVRQSLNATAIDFQRRIDAQASLDPTVSAPTTPAEITSRETKFEGQSVTLPAQNDNQNPFTKNSTGFDTPTIGTATNPYGLGANRTTTDPDPADDQWSLADGPFPTGGGPYDGVTGPLVRFFLDPSLVSSDQFTDTLGNTVTITIDQIYGYKRPITVDSAGRVVLIGPEQATASFPLFSSVNFS